MQGQSDTLRDMGAPDAINEATVREVARLARLRVPDADLPGLARDLAAIVAHVRTLDELDLDDVEPLAHPLESTNRLMPDEPIEPMPAADVLNLAPAEREGYITVPKVLGDGS